MWSKGYLGPLRGDRREDAFPDEILVETVISCQFGMECGEEVQALAESDEGSGFVC